MFKNNRWKGIVVATTLLGSVHATETGAPVLQKAQVAAPQKASTEALSDAIENFENLIELIEDKSSQDGKRSPLEEKLVARSIEKSINRLSDVLTEHFLAQELSPEDPKLAEKLQVVHGLLLTLHHVEKESTRESLEPVARGMEKLATLLGAPYQAPKPKAPAAPVAPTSQATSPTGANATTYAATPSTNQMTFAPTATSATNAEPTSDQATAITRQKQVMLIAQARARARARAEARQRAREQLTQMKERAVEREELSAKVGAESEILKAGAAIERELKQSPTAPYATITETPASTTATTATTTATTAPKAGTPNRKANSEAISTYVAPAPVTQYVAPAPIARKVKPGSLVSPILPQEEASVQFSQSTEER